VVHLIAVFGTWLALYGIANWLFSLAAAAPWGLVALVVLYLAVIAVHIPMRLLAVTAVFVGIILAVILALPELPAWMALVWLLTIPAWYKVQAWSHRVWNIEKDMAEFDAKYRKGRVLFVLLTIYEPAILLNYLLFDRKNWV
jgi:hypothetical protein